MRSLGEVNRGLANIGIPVVLSVDDAARVSSELGRDKFVDAIKKAQCGNNNAQRWLEVNLSKIGLLESGPDTTAGSADVCQSQPDNGCYQDEGESNGGSDDRLSYHVYGKDALCFEVAETRGGFKTIQIDAAKAGNGKQKDWANKITIQLTSAELPIVLAVLMRAKERCEFSAHGPNKDKGFRMEVQGDNVYCKFFAKDKPVVGVPVTPGDRAHLIAFFIRQFLQNYPWMDATSVIFAVRS